MSLPSVSPSPTAKTDSEPTLVRGLSLLDSVLLLAGGIIGSSIFLTAKDIAGPLPHPLLFLAGLGAGRRDLPVRLRCLCRTGLDVSRLRRTVRLPA